MLRPRLKLMNIHCLYSDDDSKVEGSLVANERVLRIGNVAMSDAGLYECVGIGDTKCASVSLRVHGKCQIIYIILYITSGSKGGTREPISKVIFYNYTQEK